jgi:hypothetical protein
VTTIAAPRVPAHTSHWENELFSTTATRPGHGPDAPRFDGVDGMLDDSRSRLARVSARAAYQEVLFKRAVVVDVRPQAQREQEGEVHQDLGPVVIERNLLEWRLDPAPSVMPVNCRLRAEAREVPGVHRPR